MEQSKPGRSNESVMPVRRPLDALNFFLADVRGGLGPYLAVYLLVERGWDEAGTGVVMSIATAAEIVAQTPAGALVDAIRAKRVLMAVAALAVTAVSLLLPWLTAFWSVAASQAIAHAASAVFGPAIAAVTLGAVGRQAFSKRIGRNESFNHAGNAFAALTAGVFAYIWGPIVVSTCLAPWRSEASWVCWRYRPTPSIMTSPVVLTTPFPEDEARQDATPPGFRFW
jgi:MFS family permease